MRNKHLILILEWMLLCRILSFELNSSLCITFGGFQGLPGLSPIHYVTLSIVRRYLDFKVTLLFLID